MIMKLKNIFNTLSLAAVALVATGCQDTDAQIDIQEVDAPSYVSVTPAETSVMLYGEKTITVTFRYQEHVEDYAERQIREVCQRDRRQQVTHHQG